MAKVYKVKFKPKNCIILGGSVYYADQIYETELTDKQVVALKQSMEVISHSLIGEKVEEPKKDSLVSKRGRPTKKV